MREYAELIPNAPERFIRIVEARSVDVAEREKKLVDADVRLADAEISEVRTGRRTAVGLLIGFGGAAAVFFALGNNVAGIAFLSVPVLGFLGQLLSSGARALASRQQRLADSASQDQQGKD